MKICILGILLAVRFEKSPYSDDPPRLPVVAEAPEEPHMVNIGIEAEFADFSDIAGFFNVQQTGINSLVLDDLIYTGKMVFLIILGYASLLFSAVFAAKFLTG